MKSPCDELRSSPRRHLSRRRRRWSFDRLEDRLLLANGPGTSLGTATPLLAPSALASGQIEPGVPLFFQTSPATDSLLIARAAAVGTPTRLSLLDSQGTLLVQSDGQSATNPDDLIEQHVAPGTSYLELQSLGGAGSYTLTASLTASPPPNELPSSELPAAPPSPLVVFGNFDSTGPIGFAAPDGVHQGQGDGTFTRPTTPLPISALITTPIAMVGGDFTGDGHEDLAVVGYSSSEQNSSQAVLEVLLGNGDGTFRAEPPIVLNDVSPQTLVAGDFTGDGRADLVVGGLNGDAQGQLDVLISRGDGTFAAQAPMVLGDVIPTTLVPADFTGDGVADLAVAGAGPGGQANAQVLLGNGDGTFAPLAPVSLGSMTVTSLVANDFNGDGQNDLAVAGYNEFGGQVNVLPGNGDGTFGAALTTYLSVNSPTSLVSGAFDGSGQVDLAVAGGTNFSGDQAEVLLGNGDGTFSPGAPISLATSNPTIVNTPASLTAGDWNGDGHTDLAVGVAGVQGAGQVDVLLGNGDGTFTPLAPTGLGSFTPSIIVAGDFGSDGRSDLAAAGVDGSGNTVIEVFPSNGDGTFGTAAPIALGSIMVTAMVSGDFNGDGHTDLAFAGVELSGQEIVGLLPGESDGTFGVLRTIGFIPSVAPQFLVVGDFTGDGRDDLAVAGLAFGVESIQILLGNGDGTLRATEAIALGAFTPIALVAGQWSGNAPSGLAIAGTNSSGLGQVLVFESNGNGTFAPLAPISLGALTPTALAAGDFNQDGATDLAVTGTDPSGASDLEVLQSAGDGTFHAGSPIDLGVFTVQALVTGDFLGNGHTSLAVAGVNPFLQGQVDVYSGQGDGTFQAEPPIVLGQSASFPLVSGDWSGDGRSGLAIAGDVSYGPGQVNVLLSSGNGTFGAAAPAALGNVTPSSSVSGDFNNDGRADLAVAGVDANFNGVVDILQGNGDGTFDALASISLDGVSPLAIATGDFNGDGRADLAVVGNDPDGNTDLEVLLGNGDGTFAVEAPIVLPPLFFGAPLFASIAVGDFEGNGHADLAISEVVSAAPFNQVVVMLGDGTGSFSTSTVLNDMSGLGNLVIPTALVSADFTGNGRDDLALAGDDFLGDELLEVLLSNGDGTFGTPMPVALPTGPNEAPIGVGLLGTPYYLVAGDWGGDGRADLAVTSVDPTSGQQSVLVLPGNGDGTFGAAATLDLGSVTPTALLSGDFNGDGKTDLALVTSTSLPGRSGVVVLPGNGDGTFGAPINSIFRANPTSVVTADLAGDGRTSLALVDASGVQVELSLGNGHFAATSTIIGPIEDTPVVADPGDGTDDVFIVDQSGDILWRRAVPGSPGSFGPPVTINPGDPSRAIAIVPTSNYTRIASVDLLDNRVSLYAFVAGRFLPVGTLATGAIPVQIATADLNGDGNTDLVIRNAGDGTATVYLGRGDGTFVRQADVPIGLGASDIALADLDGTGVVDLVVTNQVSGTVSVWHGNGDGTFAAPATYQAGSGPYAPGIAADGATVLTSLQATAGVAVGTFSAGGAVGLATVDPGSNSIAVLDGLGGGALANPSPLLTSTPATVIRGGDWSGDGVTDLAVLGAAGLSVFLANDAGGFGPATNYYAGLDPTGLTVADVNGDGIPDLIVGNGHGDVLVLVGNGHGQFAPYHNVDEQVALAVVDSGSSGRPSIAISDTSQSLVAVQPGPGAAPQTVGTQSQGVLAPGAVTLADLTGDGIPDMIVANSGGNDVLVYPGLGHGQFGAALEFPVGTDPVSVTVADLTDNGIPDLVVANHGSNDLSILLGKGSGASWTLVAGPRLKAGGGPTSTVVTNLNGDGIPDILVSDGQSNDVRFLQGLGGGFFNDVNPPVFQTGSDPVQVMIGSFMGQRAGLDLVTVNAASNDLTFFPDINSSAFIAQGGTVVAHGGDFVGQSIPSGGVLPIAAVAGDFQGGAATDLLVANNADGHLALFQGGPDGLVLERTFEEAQLPNPTALATDSQGDIFAATEGVDAAIAVVLGLGIGTPGGSQESGGEVQGQSPPPAISVEQQTVVLEPLTPSTLGLVATLLSVTVETTTIVGPVTAQQGGGSGAAAGGLESGVAEEAEGLTVATTAALPNQPLAKGGIAALSDQDGEEALSEAAEPPSGGQSPTQAPAAAPATVARFVTGLEEAFARARQSAGQLALVARVPGLRTGEQTLRTLDALLTRHSPVIAAMAGSVTTLAVELARTGVAIASLVDAAVHALDAEAHRPAAAQPDLPQTSTRAASPWRPAAIIGAMSIGVAVLARTHSQNLRPWARATRWRSRPNP